ncbi:MAG TPA: holo-ACP synthase [Tepidisphaeraceae bacterium]|nr:holo-ACP synthase [Tepidisphaeraceae bacterium]
MPILGHGIDIIETARIRKSVEEHGRHFLDRVFTPAEQRYCALSQKRYYEHLAARFAAKEAVLKVLGTGWRGGIAWTDVEVIREPSGQPKVVLTGECLRIASELGITRWHLSMSHIETHATASAIGMSGSLELLDHEPGIDSAHDRGDG